MSHFRSPMGGKAQLLSKLLNNRLLTIILSFLCLVLIDRNALSIVTKYLSNKEINRLLRFTVQIITIDLCRWQRNDIGVTNLNQSCHG